MIKTVGSVVVISLIWMGGLTSQCGRDHCLMLTTTGSPGWPLARYSSASLAWSNGNTFVDDRHRVEQLADFGELVAIGTHKQERVGDVPFFARDLIFRPISPNRRRSNTFSPGPARRQHPAGR